MHHGICHGDKIGGESYSLNTWHCYRNGVHARTSNYVYVFIPWDITAITMETFDLLHLELKGHPYPFGYPLFSNSAYNLLAPLIYPVKQCMSAQLT